MIKYLYCILLSAHVDYVHNYENEDDASNKNNEC